MDLIWIMGALLAGLLARALRLPTLVGYLAAGFILAGAGVQGDATLSALGDLGVTLLLFTIGLHLRLKNLLRLEVLGVAGTHLLISALIFGVVLTVLGTPALAILPLAVGLAFSSTVLSAKTLEGRGELDSYHGRIAIGILIFQDVVAVALLAFSGSAVPVPWAAALLLLPLLRPVLLRLLEGAGREEVLLLLGVGLALGAEWLFDLVGVSGKLGALVVGMILAGHAAADVLYERLWGLRELFLVAFFLEIGLLGLPSGGEMGIVVLILLLLPLKGVLFFLLMLWFRLRARTAFLAALSLTAYSEFALIVAAAAAEAQLVPPALVTVLALLVAASFALNAPLSRAANPLWQRYGPRLVRLERNLPHPDHPPATFGSAHFLVLGMGRAGSAAYDYLIEHGQRPLGLDNDPGQIERQLQAGRRVVFGDAQDPALWEDVNLTNIEGVILTLPELAAKERTAEGLRLQGYTGPINALLREPGQEEVLRRAGVTAVGLPLTEVGRELAELSLKARALPVVGPPPAAPSGPEVAVT